MSARHGEVTAYVTSPGVTAPHPVPSHINNSPPNPPPQAEGATSNQDPLGIACPRCKAPQGSACVERTGGRRPVPHAARQAAASRPPEAVADPAGRQTLERYPGLDAHQVNGAVHTLRWAQRARRRNPGFFDGPPPDLSPDGVRAKVAELYRGVAL
jgi:hypothetical protein